MVDAHTVRFHFSEGYPYQLVDANDGKILPRHAWSQLPLAEWRRDTDWFREHLVVSGPYRLAAWTPGQEILLERNERYFEPDLPRLDRVRFRVVPDQSAQIEQLLSGALDFLPSLTADQAARIAASSGVELLVFEGRQYDYICWNTLRPPFDDADVRRALTLAIDRQALVDTLWRGYARVAASPILANVWARATGPLALALRPARGEPDPRRRGLPRQRRRRNARPRRPTVPLRAHHQLLEPRPLGRAGARPGAAAADRRRCPAAHARDPDPDREEHRAPTSTPPSPAGRSTRPSTCAPTSTPPRRTAATTSARSATPSSTACSTEVRKVDRVEDAAPVFDRIQRILHAEQPYTFLWEPQRLAGARRELAEVEPNSLSPLFNLARWWRRAPAPRG